MGDHSPFDGDMTITKSLLAFVREARRSQFSPIASVDETVVLAS